MIANFQNGHDVLYHHAKFGEVELCTPAVGAKMCFIVCKNKSWFACAWGT